MMESTAMTIEELAAIETRVKAASPGPWFYDEIRYVLAPDGRGGTKVPGGGTLPQFRPDDVTFVVAAREDVPALIAEVRRLGAENERLRRENEEMRADLSENDI